MADIFVDGFDKYGPVGMGANSAFGQTALENFLTQGDWTIATAAANVSFQIVASLNQTTGYALKITGLNASNPSTLARTMPASYARVIFGIRFSSDLLADGGIVLSDGTSPQVALRVNGLTGLISLLTGAASPLFSGAVLSTSTISVSANTTHFLELDVTIGASAAYHVWLDGVSLFSGTGNTRGGTANNTVNVFEIAAYAMSLTVDDLYVFDSTGGTNNAVLNTGPAVETDFASADSAVQFAFGAAMFGQAFVGGAANVPTNGTDGMVLRRFVPPVAGTCQSISFIPEVSNAGVKMKPAIYADSSGSPGSLLSAGSEVVALVTGTAVTMPLTTPQALTGGTAYWIGFIYNSVMPFANSLAIGDNALTGYGKTAGTVTYASGPPNPAGAVTSGFGSYTLWGNLTGVSTNYSEENFNPPPGDFSYVTDSTVGHEDLYSFPGLAVTASVIYTVCVKGYVRKSAAGARTVEMRMKSAAVESSGSNTGLAPDTSYRWLYSFFDTDPNTSAAWTATNLNNATSGVKVIS